MLSQNSLKYFLLLFQLLRWQQEKRCLLSILLGSGVTNDKGIAYDERSKGMNLPPWCLIRNLILF